jgi:hypothetical protein
LAQPRVGLPTREAGSGPRIAFQVAVELLESPTIEAGSDEALNLAFAEAVRHGGRRAEPCRM